MEAMSRDEFDVVAAHLTPASLAACMMVSKTVREFTNPHYEPGFIADYELQQSKWSRTAFIRDVKTVLADLVRDVVFIHAFPCGVCISAEALRLLHAFVCTTTSRRCQSLSAFIRRVGFCTGGRAPNRTSSRSALGCQRST